MNLTVNSGSQSIAGSIADAASVSSSYATALTKDGTGTLTLSGSLANSYSGVTTVNAGVLSLAKSAGVNAVPGNLVIGDGAGGIDADIARLQANEQIANTANVTINSSGLLDLNGFTETINTLTLAGGHVRTGGGVLNTTQSPTFNSGTASLSSDAGLGSGTLAFNGGTLKADGGPRILSNALTLGGDTTFDGSDALTFSGASTLTGDRTLSVNNLTTFSGAISQDTPGRRLNKSGTGTLILSGINTYTGPTTVSGGLLKISGSIASSAVTVNSGGTLSGRGTVGSLTVASGGTLAPGDSPGTTVFTDTVYWNGGGNYVWEINKANGTKGGDPGWDLLTDNYVGYNIIINATSDNNFNIRLTTLTLGNASGPMDSFDNTQNYSWTIATAGDGYGGFSADKFNLDTSAFQNALGGGSFGISLSNGARNLNLTFSAVPEPHEYALVVGIGLLGFAVWRRRGHLTPAKTGSARVRS